MKRLLVKLIVVGSCIINVILACQKEQEFVRLELSVESKGDNKMYIDGVSSYWQTGDVVYVNGVESSIRVTDGHAYAEGDFSGDYYYILFPAAICQERMGDVVTVNMPATYQYRTSHNGDYVYHQVLDAPMAYSGAAIGGRATLMHLTGALNVHITGPSGIQIDRITVSTTQNRAMSGTMQFDLSNLNNIGSSATSTTGNNSVQLLFDRYSFSMGTVQIPVPVLSGNVNFIVKVEGHVQGTKYTFERAQSTGGHLGRGELGNVTVNLNEGQVGVTTSALFPTRTIGTKTYYEISNPKDFLLMSDAVWGNTYREDGDTYLNRWGYGGLEYKYANYFVTTDLDMTGIVFAAITGFEGELNGGGHTIRNLTVSSLRHYNEYESLSNYRNWGLFDATTCTQGKRVSVRNITFENLTINTRPQMSGSEIIGALFSVTGSGTTVVDDVHITNFRLNTPTSYTPDYYQWREYIGGFFGTSSEGVSISNSSITFASNQDFFSSEVCMDMRVGGIYGNGLACVADNVMVDFGTQLLNSTSVDYYFGGIGAGSILNGGTYAPFNGVCSDVVVIGNIFYSNGTFGNVTPTVSVADGVDASRLTITQN